MPMRRPAPRPQAAPFLPAAIFALKLLASALAGAAVTMLLWQDWKPAAPASLVAERLGTPYPDRRATRAYRSEPRAARGGEEDPITSELDRAIPSNYPRRVKTVKFTPPTDLTRSSPDADARKAAIEESSTATPAHLTGSPPDANLLTGRALRYLIGASAAGSGRDDDVTEVSYDATEPVKRGISIAYCNLFDEKSSGRFGPYLHTSDTASQYHEGQIDPRGPGWEKNLRAQFERRKKQGFEFIELDNPDAYSVRDVIGAIDLAATYGLKVIAKNPMLLERDAASYVAHPNVYGVIVERGAGNPDDMDALRRKAGKPTLPVWFVAFGSGRAWAASVASAAKRYRGMGVTYSSAGEYGNAIDLLPPA
jgi:hypothetical protein